MKKKTLWIGLVTMLFMFVAIGTVAMAASSQAYTAEQYAEYKSNGTYPTAEGRLFGGWFADDTLATVYTGEAGEMPTAKFADKDILGVKYQISGGATAASASVKVRVVTSVDNLNYNRVGFIITTDAGLNRMVSIQDVYQTLTGYDGVEVFSYNPTVFSAESTYFAACIFSIPQSQFDTVLHIQPFWKTLDGTIVTGTVRDVSVSSTPGFSAIAKIGADEFYYLQDAVEAATDGDTIELLGDPTVDATIAISKNLTITGDGYTVTHGAFDGAAFTVASGKTLTIGNGTDAITLDGNGTGKALVDATGTLSVKGGATLKGKVDLEASATLTVAGNCKVGIADGTADSGVDFSSAVTVTGDDVAADAEVVLQDSLNLTVNGTGSEEAFTILEPHNKVVKVSGNFGFAANMCVCGVCDGQYNHTADCYQPDVWRPWTEAISKATYSGAVYLPMAAGCYYLTEGMALPNRSDYSSGKVTIDLNGQQVSSTAGNVAFMKGAATAHALNISDSVGTGVIEVKGAGSYARLVYVGNASGAVVNIFGGTINAASDATATSAGFGGMITIFKGRVNVYGGTISPCTVGASSASNCIAVGYSGETPKMYVYGGIIKGEVMLVVPNARLEISGDAEVGINDGSDNSYGIGVTAGKTIECTDVTGKIVLKNTDDPLIKVSGTGKGSAFTDCPAGHNRYGVDGADDDTIGTLTLCKAQMCTCGAIGAHTAIDAGGLSCAIPASPWQAWAATNTYLPGATGSYYLVGDMTISSQQSIGTNVTVNLDLNGYTVTGAANLNRILRMANGSNEVLTIADSSAAKTGTIIAVGTAATAGVTGRVIWMQNTSASTLCLYGGTFTGDSEVTESIIHRGSGYTCLIADATVEGRVPLSGNTTGGWWTGGFGENWQDKFITKSYD